MIRFSKFIFNIKIYEEFIEFLSVEDVFETRVEKCENNPNLLLGSLKVFIVENQTQNSKSIMNKRLMML